MIELMVSGMRCGGCAGNVRSAIANVDGSAEVEVDLSTGIVSIQSSRPTEQFATAIEAAGYKATMRA